MVNHLLENKPPSFFPSAPRLRGRQTRLRVILFCLRLPTVNFSSGDCRLPFPLRYTIGLHLGRNTHARHARDAWKLLCEYTASESLRKHMLAVEGVCARLLCAAKPGADEENLGAGGAACHDFDYERWPNQEQLAGSGASFGRCEGFCARAGLLRKRSFARSSRTRGLFAAWPAPERHWNNALFALRRAGRLPDRLARTCAPSKEHFGLGSGFGEAAA